MIKILTILTLLYFITVSALPNVETNNGIESVKARTKKNNQQADELLDNHEQDRNLCSRRKDSNEVDLDVGYEPPVSEETQLNASGNNPESDSQLQSVNKNQEGKLHRGTSNEVYYKENPDHKHVTFDEQMKQLFYKNQDDVNQNSSGFRNEKEAPSNNEPSNEQEQEVSKYSNEVNSPNVTAVDEGESSDSHFKSSSDNQDQKQKNYNPADPTKSNQVEGGNKSSNEEQDNKESLSEKIGSNEGGFKMDQNCPFPESTRRANYEGPEVIQINDNSDPNKPVAPVKQVRKNNQRYNTKFLPVDTQLTDPASVGVVPMSPAAGLSLLEHNRVCYACTSASNPTCVQPDRRTTVKYCLKGHESCVTKTYQTGKDKDSLVLIRDCGTSCDDTEVPGYRYKSCKVCHTDVCNDEPFNGAFSIQSQSFIITLLGILLIKYTI